MAFDLLFVCTGNTCRSPMAEALLRRALPAEKAGQYHIHSAGLNAAAGEPASRHAIEALREIGIDLSVHRSRPITGDDVEKADLVLTMTRAQADEVLTRFPASAGRVYPLTDYAERSAGSAPIEDPAGSDLPLYRATRDAIRKAVDAIAGHM